MVKYCFPKFMFFFDKSTRSNPGVEAIILFQKEWKWELFPMKLKYLETSQIRNKTKIQKENIFDLLKNSHLNVKLFCKEDSVLFDVNKHCVHLKESSLYISPSKISISSLLLFPEGECKIQARARTMTFNCKMMQIFKFSQIEIKRNPHK